MLTGKELGKAIRDAVDMKDAAERKAGRPGVRLVDVAHHFGVKPPSVQDWINKGTINKGRLPALWLYFSDVVGPEHWGLVSFPQARVPGGVFEEITDEERRLLDNFRLLPDPEQARYSKEISERAELLRAYLDKQLPRFQRRHNQPDADIAYQKQNGSTVEEPQSRPADLFGIDELGSDAGDGNARSSDNSGAHEKNRRRA